MSNAYYYGKNWSADLLFRNLGQTGDILSLSGVKLLIKGDRIGLSADICYVAVFPHKQANNYWYIGAHFMSEYVTILDNSRSDTGNGE